MDRKDFMKKAGLAGLVSLGFPNLVLGSENNLSGKITDTLSEESIQGVELTFTDYVSGEEIVSCL